MSGARSSPNIEAPNFNRYVKLGNSKTAASPDAAGRGAHCSRRWPEYLKHPPPAQFHFIVSPLVMWIWIGGLIVFGGGLIAMWPAPSAVRRRVGARSRARSGRGWPAPEPRGHWP